MAKWPYGTPEWKALRAAKLAASPLCEPCHQRGRSVRANTVDHVTPISRGGAAFPPLSGLMSMCHVCHNTKTWGADRDGGRGVAMPGCGTDGLPIDPAHPFFGGKGITPCKDKQLGPRDRPGARIYTKFDRGGI